MRYLVEFSLSTIFLIQALLVSIIIFVFFAQNPTTRIKRQHHSVLVMLFLNFIQLLTDLPMAMAFHYQGIVLIQSDSFCAWWVWLTFSVETIALFLCLWISIERHFIIFHSHLIDEERWRTRIFHIVPIIFCCLWAPTLYLFLIILSPQCTNVWDYRILLCGPPCYTYTAAYGIYDFLCNVCLPLFLVIIINIILFIRIIKEKLERQRRIDWRKYRKMILQFWAVSSLHVALWSPLVIVSLVQLTIMPTFMIDQYTTLQYVLYYMPLLLPATCLIGMPELTKKLMDFIQRQKLKIVPHIDFPLNT